MINIPQRAGLGQAPLPSLHFPPAKRKAQLIILGLTCLSRGEWRMVMAITHLIQRRGWSHV
jgi:hypothetical protein